MKARLAIAGVASLCMVLAAPSEASACASLGGVHSFTGHAYVSLAGTASGPIEGANEDEAISLDRRVASLELKLNHRVRGKGEFAGLTIFGGKAKLGSVTVQDRFSSGEDSGEETYSGATLPLISSAELFLDTDDCRYALSATFGAQTKFSGEQGLQPGSGVSVSVDSDRNKIPQDLHLIGGVGPDAYLTCPGDPILTGKPCMQFAGGWSNDFAELALCGSFPPSGDCATKEEPVADGKFIWVLKSK